MSTEEGYVMAYEDAGADAVHRVKVLEKSLAGLKVQILSTGELEIISPNDFFPIDDLAEKGIANLSDLKNFNEAGLLINLQNRYSQQKIYTQMNSTLIILNPYSQIPGLISQSSISQYLTSDINTLPPHIFTTAKSAFEAMREKKSSQVILISGESGAGKTETAKHVIRFLTSVSHENSSEIEQKILSCSPILEAFGNAKTVRNDNSSRFGKFVKLYYDSSKSQIISASIESFLLEKTRVVKHNDGERNYHIFYLLGKHAPAGLIEDLGLAQGKSFDFQDFYYTKGETDAGTVNDKEFYSELIQAFQVNSFAQNEVNYIWRILGAILSLGNVEFDSSEYNENTPCKILSKTQIYFENCARLLEIASEDIYNALVFITRNIGNKEIKSPLDEENCEALRDTMAKYLYDRLFAWIIRKLNLGLKGREGNFIGILDIYGFEVFAQNGFEQFCINYANEKLQQLSNDYIFKSEQEELRKEGLDVYTNSVSYVDNQEILNILEANPLGIFRLIDESCTIKSDDKNLLQSIFNKHKANQVLIVPKSIRENFQIRHTATDVTYTITGFTSKNIDEIRPEIVQCVAASSSKIIQHIMKNEPKTGKFLGEKFRKEMNLLMTEIRTCNCFFVRCLKPNEEKIPWTLMPRLVLNQIQYLGLLDSIMIRKKGYPIRMVYSDFYERFQCLDVPRTVHKSPENDWKAVSLNLCKKLIEKCGVDKMLLGKTKVFLVPAAEKICENFRNEKVLVEHSSAKKIQGWIRARKKYWDFRKIIYNIPRIQAVWKGTQQRKKYQSTLSKIVKIQQWFKNIIYRDQIALRDFGLQIFYQYLKIKIEDSFLEKCFKLAITTQKIWRGHRTRRLLKGKKLISQVFNNKIFRPCWKKIMKQSTLQAVMLIQRCYRGFICRKNIAPSITKTLQENKLNRMTVKVQKWFRGEIVRKKISRVRSAAVKIQGFWKAKKARNYFVSLCRAVYRIQSAFRTYTLRSKVISARLEDFTSKELALLKNLTVLEHSELFSSQRSASDVHMQEALKTLSTIAENTANLTHNQLVSTGSLGIQSRQVSPFHIEKLYFFTRPLDFELVSDDSIIYEPLWSKQFEILNIEVIRKEEQIMDIAVGNCHTLAVTSKGKVFAWGWNDKYQCGAQGTRPRIVEGLKDHKIVQVTCGDDHSLVLTANGEVLGFGDNSKGQLGQGTYTDIKSVVQLEIPQCKQVVSVGNQNMAVTQSGELYLWPFETIHGDKRSYPMKMLYDYTVNEVSVGFNFAMILATSGILFSLGSNNRSGQLGHGDCLPRSSPTIILFLKKIGEKISNVSCGYQHVISKSNLGKVYTWGCGNNGQLGHGTFKNEISPRIVLFKVDRVKPVQISAGYRDTVVLMENRKVLWAGTNTMIKSPGFVETNIAGRLPELFANPGEFAVLKISSIWSRILTCTLVTIGDLRYIQNANTKLQSGLGMISAKWTSKSIEPPFIENIAGYFPTSLCKKNNSKQSMQKVTQISRHPLEEMKEKISEILKKPKEKWTLEDKFTMEHITKLSH